MIEHAIAPVEPTEKMIAAGLEAWEYGDGPRYHPDFEVNETVISRIYLAMIEAALEEPSE
jgi:hypothetical protein